MKKILELAKAILIPLIIGGIVGLIVTNFIDYEIIKKPPLSPPEIVFPIVWTVLYILMGISYGTLKIKNLVDKEINSVYYTQLLVNATWPIIFFIFKWRFIAILWTLLLLGLVIYMIIIFYKKNKLSGLLQIPYMLWTVFATYLTIGVFIVTVLNAP